MCSVHSSRSCMPRDGRSGRFQGGLATLAEPRHQTHQDNVSFRVPSSVSMTWATVGQGRILGTPVTAGAEVDRFCSLPRKPSLNRLPATRRLNATYDAAEPDVRGRGVYRLP